MIRKHPRWPKSANALPAEISRVEPHLRKLGVEVECGRKKAARYLRLRISKSMVDDIRVQVVTDEADEKQEVVAA